jgi:hypothetical protein
MLDSNVKQRENMRSHSRGMLYPGFASFLPSSRTEGAGKAGRRLHPWVPCNKKHGGRTTGSTGSSGFPCAMVYGLFRALPGDRAFLPPSPLRSLLLKSLMPASGHQDHTTSPSASGALVFGTVSVHRIPLRVRDVAQRPSVGRDGGGYRGDLGKSRSGIFLRKGLDTE